VPARSNPRQQGNTDQVPAAFLLLVAVLAFTPVFRAGATPLAALGSQILATALLIVVLWSPRRLTLDRAQAAVLVLLAVLPALYLLPLPASIAEALPGRSVYAEARALLPSVQAPLSAALALYPGAAAAAVLSMILPIGVFVGVRVLSAKQMETLLFLIILIAALQALLGLVQYGIAQGGGTPLTVEGAHRLSGVGTYANRNHLAGLIEMALPLTLALLFYALSRIKGAGAFAGSVKRRAVALGSRPGLAALLHGAVALLLIVGAVFTRSRTGIALTILGILLATVVFAGRIGKKSALGPAGLILSLAVAAGISIGLAPVLDRFSLADLEDDARWQIFDQTLLGAGAMFPIGGGPGSFPFAFPAFQPLELGWAFINRAHNDYLEWLFDLGAAGALLVLLVLVLFALQWRRVLAAPSVTRISYLQIGSGISVLLLGLHELVDYNLFTPANQVVFAFLLSVFLYPPERFAETTAGPRRRQRRTPNLVPLPQPKPFSAAPPPDQIENPFLGR
jgi:O-antigen ligase